MFNDITSFSIDHDHIFSPLKSEVGWFLPGPCHQWSQTYTLFCSSWPVLYVRSSIGVLCYRIKEVWYTLCMHYTALQNRHNSKQYYLQNGIIIWRKLLFNTTHTLKCTQCAHKSLKYLYLCNSRCWSRSICRAFLLSGSIVLFFSSFSIEQLSHLANLFSCNNINMHVVIQAQR